MKKDKKPQSKTKKKHTHTSGDANYILGIIQTLGREANLKSLFPKILKPMKQEEIILALYELERSGAIRMEQKGKIKLLQSFKTKLDTGRTAKYVFGTADITRTGTGYVSVPGMEQDIFIPHKFVHNAMQGDEVKVRMTMFGRRPEGEI
ncbi:MAG TPA: hypothetical protein VK174_13010, partial [Chitinophagales bacterium]|nr:hypothetical protein [Chitinophagales bacterium]